MNDSPRIALSPRAFKTFRVLSLDLTALDLRNVRVLHLSVSQEKCLAKDRCAKWGERSDECLERLVPFDMYGKTLN